MTIRTTRQYVDVLTSGAGGNLRVSRQYVEVLCSLPAGSVLDATAETLLNLSQRVSRAYEESVGSELNLDGVAVVSKTVAAASDLTLDNSVDVYFGIRHRTATTANDLSQVADFDVARRRNVASLLTLSQDASYVGPKWLDAESVLVLADSSRRTDTFEEAAKSTLSFAERASLAGTQRKSATTALTIQQYADNRIRRRDVTTELVLADTATVEKVYRAVSVLTLGQLAQEGFIPLRAETVISLSQFARWTEITVGPGPGYRVDLPATQIQLGQEAKSNIRHVTAESALSLAVGLDVRKPIYLAATTVLQTVTTDYDDSLRPFEIVEGLDSAAGYILWTAHQSATRLPLWDAAQAVLVKASAIALDATSDLVLDQDVFLSTTAGAQSWLTLSDVAVGHLGKVAESAILIVDEAVATVTRNLSAVTAITLSQSFGYTIAYTGVQNQYHPFIGGGDVAAASVLPAPPPLALSGPMAGITAPFQLVYPAVGPVTQSVTLRAPNLGNRDRLQFNRISRETRGGTLVVYADPIWPKVQTLVLQFSGLLQAEALGLLAFLEDHLGEEIGLIDWEHRYWKGVIVNPTDAVVQDGKNQFSASFEFEGELDDTWNPQVIPPPVYTPPGQKPVKKYANYPVYTPSEMDVDEYYTAEVDVEVAIGSPIYLTANGHVRLARANGQPQMQVAGLSTTNTEAGFACKYISEGVVTQADWTEIAGTALLVPGSLYFLDSASPGKITTTSPSASGVYVVCIGRAVSPLSLDIEIGPSIRL